MSTQQSTGRNADNSISPPKYAFQLKVCFDFLYYLCLLLMTVGLIMIVIVGLNIPEEVSQRHTDIEYWFNAKLLPQSVTDPSASEILLAHGMLKLNNTSGYAAWYIAYIEVVFNGIVTLIGLYNLRKLFANLASHRAFEVANVTYIKRLGITVLSYSVLAPVITYVCGMAILGDIGQFYPSLQLSPYFSFPFEGLLVGGALLVLAQIINDATVMKQEQSLTI